MQLFKWEEFDIVYFQSALVSQNAYRPENSRTAELLRKTIRRSLGYVSVHINAAVAPL